MSCANHDRAGPVGRIPTPFVILALRTHRAVNGVCQLAGLAGAEWTDSSLSGCL
jgi:hypothetical protein